MSANSCLTKDYFRKTRDVPAGVDQEKLLLYDFEKVRMLDGLEMDY